MRLPQPTRNQIDELAARWNVSIANVMTIAIDRMYQQEIKTMTTVKDVASVRPATDEPTRFERLVALVTTASKRGEWYDGPGSTNISDWLAEGDYTDDETIESLAAEWDK